MNNYDKLNDSYKKQHKKITEINKNVDKINVKSNEAKEILENNNGIKELELLQERINENNKILIENK